MFQTQTKTRYPKDAPPQQVVCLLWNGVGIASFPSSDTVEAEIAEYIRVHGYRAAWNAQWNLGNPIDWITNADPV